jgi:hypothetical protein
MRNNEGFEIRHNGVSRTFRDTKAAAYDAARFAKSNARGDIIEIVETGCHLRLPGTQGVPASLCGAAAGGGPYPPVPNVGIGRTALASGKSCFNSFAPYTLNT